MDALPTMAGEYGAYLPEYKFEENWVPVPVTKDSTGIPDGSIMRGINHTICLFSRSQAMALAWSFAAHTESRSGKVPEVRVVEYRVHYDIKCYRNFERGHTMTPAETRQLLEDAASACGIVLVELDFYELVRSDGTQWNPLTDITDRARMEDALLKEAQAIEIWNWPDSVGVRILPIKLQGVAFLSETSGSRELAHNLAATRCAAAVYRSRK